jgi:hypothetical protein
VCRQCDGAGLLYPNPELRGVFEALLQEVGPFGDPKWRLVMNGLVELEKRVDVLEASHGTRSV